MRVIPALNKNSRNREYDSYAENLRCRVLYSYLFEGKSHRQIDKEVLELDDEYSRGYQTMGILHHLGVVGEFKGLFYGCELPEAINELKNLKDDDYSVIINMLESFMVDGEYIDEDIEIENNNYYPSYKEGKKIVYYTTKYERNRENRKEAIRVHGTICMACGFDFEKVYGNRGKDFIEVHHIVPLSDISEEVSINPKTDLVVLCANCHRMVHRKRNYVLTVEELKELINMHNNSK